MTIEVKNIVKKFGVFAALDNVDLKVDKGEFAKVGQSIAALQSQILQRERLEKIREGLRKNLDEVNKELAELEKAATGEKK